MKNYLEFPDTSVFKEQLVIEYFKDPTNVYPLETILEIQTKTLLNSLKPLRPNIYGLYIRQNSHTPWQLKYIGQRKSGSLVNRLREHLYKKDARTGAKLELVEKALVDNNQVGIALFQIAPDTLRHYYEVALINKLNPEWNKQR